MAGKILEGLWDCPYCGEKGIGGLTKTCPNCAHPQDADTKFYLGSEKKALSDEKAKNYGKGADWTCSFCGSLNRYDRETCANCGAGRADSSGSYFDNLKKREASAQPSPPPPAPKRSKKRIIIPLLLVIAVLLGLRAIIPRSKDAVLIDKSWERSITLEQYATVEEEDWSVPSGGTLLDSRRAVHHYDQILDHYEEETYQVPERVLDGYDTYTDYVDNGDGTFSEVVREEPRYRTEYRTETRSVPVYVLEPVYQTLYRYNIDKWIPLRTETARGSYDGSKDSTYTEPYWPEFRLGGNERENGRSETYILTFTDSKGKNSYRARVSRDIWDMYSPGDGAKITADMGRNIMEIDGMNVR
ncbi:MAG: hypothetical protein ILP09_03550 [Oscillospiraceae bacterium]|nr:hypothetical protein [Oscillospiraceae bacterium]